MTCHCPRSLTFPWQPYFDRHVFQNFEFSYLIHFMVFLLVLIIFEPILDGFLRIWRNPEIQDGGPRWPPFGNDCAIVTSCDVITSCGRQRRHFQTYYLPYKSRCHSFYILGVMEGGEFPPPPLRRS